MVDFFSVFPTTSPCSAAGKACLLPASSKLTWALTSSSSHLSVQVFYSADTFLSAPFIPRAWTHQSALCYFGIKFLAKYAWPPSTAPSSYKQNLGHAMSIHGDHPFLFKSEDHYGQWRQATSTIKDHTTWNVLKLTHLPARHSLKMSIQAAESNQGVEFFIVKSTSPHDGKTFKHHNTSIRGWSRQGGLG